MLKSYTLTQFWQKAIFLVGGGLAAVVTAHLLATRFDQTLLLSALLILALFILRNLKFGLYITILLPVAGELFRLPFGPGDGILISDAFIVILCAVWIFKRFFSTDYINSVNTAHPPHSKPVSARKTSRRSPLTIPFILFIIAGALSLFQSLLFLSPGEVAGGSFYLIRFLFYGLLYFITIQSIKSEKDFKNALYLITLSAILIAVAGFIQLAVYPDLADLEQYGWDPHINRLVSTWLDPNFVGGFLAFISSILLGIALHLKKPAHKAGLLIIIAILASAVFLTFSRSAYLAFATGVLIISLLKSRKILIIALILATLGIATSQRAQERTAELFQSVTAVFTQTPQTPDPTAKLRIESYNQALYLIQKRPFLGSGYNNLRTVNHREGFTSDPDIHSAGGSDSSLLTILAATGLAGLIPFILIYLTSLTVAFKNWRARTQSTGNSGSRKWEITGIKAGSPGKNSEITAGYNLGLLGGIIALLVHSIFVNSLLFTPILIFFWICLGLSHGLNKNSNKQLI